MSHLGLLSLSASDVKNFSVSIEADCYIVLALLSSSVIHLQRICESHEEHGPEMS